MQIICYLHLPFFVLNVCFFPLLIAPMYPWEYLSEWVSYWQVNNVEVIDSVDFNHWKAQTSTSVLLCTKESMDSSVLASFCYFDDPHERSDHS